MAKNHNRASFIGNLGSDMELRYTPSGTAVGRVNIAVADDYYNKKDEEWVNRTVWIPLTLFGPVAERVEKKMLKGEKVYVDCRVKNNEYTNKDGVEVRTFAFEVENVEFLSPRGNKQQQDDTPSEKADDVEPEEVDDDVPPF